MLLSYTYESSFQLSITNLPESKRSYISPLNNPCLCLFVSQMRISVNIHLFSFSFKHPILAFLLTLQKPVKFIHYVTALHKKLGITYNTCRQPMARVSQCGTSRGFVWHAEGTQKYQN
jgi:hypothetical protein